MATQQELEEIGQRFFDVCVKNHGIFLVKNEEYDNTIIRTGVLGASIEIIGAAMRLRPLVLKHHNDQVISESTVKAIKNVAVDLHNYANILMMMLEDNNWDGV